MRNNHPFWLFSDILLIFLHFSLSKLTFLTHPGVYDSLRVVCLTGCNICERIATRNCSPNEKIHVPGRRIVCDGRIVWISLRYTWFNFIGILRSAIIGHIPGYKRSLFRWLLDVRHSFRVWKQCYHALRHGWNSLTFHRLCDNKGPTLTVIRINNTIFGGFADKSWKSSTGKQSDVIPLQL